MPAIHKLQVRVPAMPVISLFVFPNITFLTLCSANFFCEFKMDLVPFDTQTCTVDFTLAVREFCSSEGSPSSRLRNFDKFSSSGFLKRGKSNAIGNSQKYI